MNDECTRPRPQQVGRPVGRDWDWGRDVRPGMLFRIDGGFLRVGSRRGVRASPGEPDPDDVLRLCRAVGRGAEVVLDLSDPATRGCLQEAGPIEPPR